MYVSGGYCCCCVVFLSMDFNCKQQPNVHFWYAFSIHSCMHSPVNPYAFYHTCDIFKEINNWKPKLMWDIHYFKLKKSSFAKNYLCKLESFFFSKLYHRTVLFCIIEIMIYILIILFISFLNLFTHYINLKNLLQNVWTYGCYMNRREVWVQRK